MPANLQMLLRREFSSDCLYSLELSTRWRGGFIRRMIFSCLKICTYCLCISTHVARTVESIKRKLSFCNLIFNLERVLHLRLYDVRRYIKYRKLLYDCNYRLLVNNDTRVLVFIVKRSYTDEYDVHCATSMFMMYASESQ